MKIPYTCRKCGSKVAVKKLILMDVLNIVAAHTGIPLNLSISKNLPKTLKQSYKYKRGLNNIAITNVNLEKSMYSFTK